MTRFSIIHRRCSIYATSSAAIGCSSAHVYRENKLYNNMPAPRSDGTVHGDAASVKYIVGRGVLLDVAKYKGQDPLPGNSWISQEDLKNTAKAQQVEIQKGDILLIRTGWRKLWDAPGTDGRVDQTHSAWHQPQPGVGGMRWAS
jgi:hypothetical protein